MLNFDDLDLVKLKIKNTQSEENKKDYLDKLKFYNSRYDNKNLSDYILLDKKPRTPKQKKKNYIN